MSTHWIMLMKVDVFTIPIAMIELYLIRNMTGLLGLEDKMLGKMNKMADLMPKL